MNGIDYPVKISSISLFEKQNNISVNVYGLDNAVVFPMRISDLRESDHHADLLYLNDDEKSHYVLINDLSRLVSAQINKSKRKKYILNFVFMPAQVKMSYKAI